MFYFLFSTRSVCFKSRRMSYKIGLVSFPFLSPRSAIEPTTSPSAARTATRSSLHRGSKSCTLSTAHTCLNAYAAKTAATLSYTHEKRTGCGPPRSQKNRRLRPTTPSKLLMDVPQKQNISYYCNNEGTKDAYRHAWETRMAIP